METLIYKAARFIRGPFRRVQPDPRRRRQAGQRQPRAARPLRADRRPGPPDQRVNPPGRPAPLRRTRRQDRRHHQDAGNSLQKGPPEGLENSPKIVESRLAKYLYTFSHSEAENTCFKISTGSYAPCRTCLLMSIAFLHDSHIRRAFRIMPHLHAVFHRPRRSPGSPLSRAFPALP